MPTQFPSVTFCNLNTFNNDDGKIFEVFTSFSENVQFQNDVCTNANATNTPYCIEHIKDLLQRYVLNMYLTGNISYDTLVGYGFDLDTEMLISCTYNNQVCDASNFTRFWHDQYGNCYTFNGNKSNALMISEAGSSHGLKIELSVRKSIFNYITFNRKRI